MGGQKTIWVLPEIAGAGEIGKMSLGLLTEAVDIAAKAGGRAEAILFSRDGVTDPGLAETLGRHGIGSAYLFKDPLFEHFSAEAYTAALLPIIKEAKPRLFLMGHTTAARELLPRLAVYLETGLVTNCVKMELADAERPKFYRPVYGDQLYQEIVLGTETTMLVSMDSRVLNIATVSESRPATVQIIEPKLSPETVRVKHLDYLPADFRTVDVTEAETIVAAGMGAADEATLPLVEALASMIQGTIGTTRPVVDGGKISRERLIGQTGKVVSPGLYLALGISGATHHVGGIQGSGKIVAVNRDPQAPIFQNSDVGIVADVREVLQKLIESIRQASHDGL
jgi:electron transfer flavoprotein alpha subunit